MTVLAFVLVWLAVSLIVSVAVGHHLRDPK
jgi:hypothetical protein